MIQLHATDMTTYPTTASPGAGGTLVDGWIDVSGVVSISGSKAVWANSGMLLRPAVENVRQELASAVFTTVASGVGPGCAVRGNSATNSAYIAFVYGGTVYMRTLLSGAQTALTYTPSGGTVAYTTGQSYACSLEARSTDSTHTTLIFKFWNLASPGTVAVYTVTGDTSTSLQAAGQVGIFQFNANDGLTSAATFDTFDPGDGAVSVSGHNITLSVTPTGGSGSYTYNWQRKSTPTGTYTTGLGASSSFVDTQTDGAVRWYNCSVSDGLVTRTMTRQGFGDTDIAAGAPDPVIPSFATIGVIGIISRNFAVVDAGDSITSPALIGYETADFALSSTGSATITVTECGHGGTFTADWLPTATATGSGQSVYDSTKNNFYGSVAAAAATGAKIVSLQIGTNDFVLGVPLGTAQANMASILAAYAAAGLNVVVHGLPYKFSQTSNYPWLFSYNAYLLTLVDGRKVFAGAPEFLLYGANHWPTAYNGDYTHPADVPGGIDALAAFRVNRVLASLLATQAAAGNSFTGSSASFVISGTITKTNASFVE